MLLGFFLGGLLSLNTRLRSENEPGLLADVGSGRLISELLAPVTASNDTVPDSDPSSTLSPVLQSVRSDGDFYFYLIILIRAVLARYIYIFES
jgi:hypothetical protein